MKSIKRLIKKIKHLTSSNKLHWYNVRVVVQTTGNVRISDYTTLIGLDVKSEILDIDRLTKLVFDETSRAEVKEYLPNVEITGCALEIVCYLGYFTKTPHIA